MGQEKNKKQENTSDIFLSNMSHELRTPINTILGLNEMILRESQDEIVKEYARDIRQAGKTAERTAAPHRRPCPLACFYPASSANP